MASDVESHRSSLIVQRSSTRGVTPPTITIWAVTIAPDGYQAGVAILASVVTA